MHTHRVSIQHPKASGSLSLKQQGSFGAAGSAFKDMLDTARESSPPSHVAQLQPLNAAHVLKPLIDQSYLGRGKGRTTQHTLKPLNTTEHGRVAESKLSLHERLTRQARKLVAQTFYGTMLKQMRQSPFKSQIFSGGRGGDAYTSLYDQQLAEHMTSGNDKLVNSIVKRLESKQQAAASQTPEQSIFERYHGKTTNRS